MARRYRTEIFEFGEKQIRLRSPLDLRQFHRPDQKGVSDEAFPLFGIVWPSARILCELLLEYDVKDKRILEIGCGMALVSILLKLRGANITAMDIHPATAELLQINVAQN
tara:strand:+ start:243 stop:572 length:330 start_codon:yes stop_codon:yes gene_type:complete